MILTKNNHLNVSIHATAFMGIWPFIFPNHPTLKKVYDTYARIIMLIFVVFSCTTYVELCRLISAEDNHAYDIMQNLCITLFYTVVLSKMFIIKSPKMVSLLDEIVKIERKMYASRDDDVIRIYDSYVKLTYFANMAFLVLAFVVTISYILTPLFLEGEPEFYEATNETTPTRLLIFSAWIPFDVQKHYWVAYSWHTLAAIVGTSYSQGVLILTYGMITFPLGQLEILGHILRNFRKYVKKVQEELGSSWNEASFVTMRECILKHKEIIRYVTQYNASVRIVMVYDFLVSSVQLATILLQLVVTEASISTMLQWGSFAMCMLLRLFIYYWFANEIMVQSGNISNAIWESEWYEKSKTIKQLMLIMIMRSHKKLGLEIGPFSTMTLESFLGIIKGAYSYLMIMYR